MCSISHIKKDLFYQATHISLGRRQTELDQTNLGLLHAGHAGIGHSLRQNQSLHQLTVIDGSSEITNTFITILGITDEKTAVSRRNSPQLLDDLDVVQVDSGGRGRVDDSHDGVHAHGGQQAGVLRHHLGAQRCGGAVEQRLAVAQLHGPAHAGQHLHAFIHGLLEGLGDDGGVDS